MCKAAPSIQAIIDQEIEQTIAEYKDIFDPQFSMPEPRPIVSPSLDEFRRSLNEFASFVSAERRMSFWQRDSGTKHHKWVKKPEALAKNTAYTFLKAKFGDTIELIEEASAGAGRVDLYTQITNGPRFLIELKICGGRNYSKNYAAAGLEQLLHYMANRKTAVGFLVIFDGRTRDYGKDFMEISRLEQCTIYTIVIDVRPTVKS